MGDAVRNGNLSLISYEILKCINTIHTVIVVIAESTQIIHRRILNNIASAARINRYVVCCIVNVSYLRVGHRNVIINYFASLTARVVIVPFPHDVALNTLIL